MTLARLIEAVADESATITSEMLGALPTHPEVPVRRLVLNIIHNGKDMNSALALHDALLPGWRVVIRQRRTDEGGDWFVRVESADFHSVQWTAGDHTRTDVLSGKDAVGIAPEAARAWLLAVLRAMDGRDG